MLTAPKKRNTTQIELNRIQKNHDCSVASCMALYKSDCIGLSRYIAITNLSIIAVFVEYLRQYLIDLNQIYRHSSVPKNTSP